MTLPTPPVCSAPWSPSLLPTWENSLLTMEMILYDTQTYRRHNSWSRTEHNQPPCSPPHCTSPGRERGWKVFPTNSIARKLETFWPTHLHSAVHAAVSGRCVLPAVRPVQEAPVAVVPKVALVRPPLIKISYLYYWVIHLWAISSISSSHTIYSDYP